MIKMVGLRVADFFCGAGGFSEGFRQKGFKVVFALDNWQPAVDTHHLNHPDCNTVNQDILELDTPEKIDACVPDAEVFIGSPPCVAFSGSNKAGKADKTLGIQLIEAYLRIIAWKKKKGVVKYWLLENVPNAGNYIKEEYTWDELGLPGKGPTLKIPQRNVLNAAEYGAPQRRKRFICGDYPVPERLYTDESEFVTLKKVLDSLSNPLGKRSGRIKDPNYGFAIAASALTDHFYDTRVADFEWKRAKRMKEDHGYMGKMSFPEDINRTSRTVMATRSASTREAIILDALGENGKHIGYRIPTIREIASFMSFPITYQFEAGSEESKYRLVGNAVCTKLSGALADAILKKEGITGPSEFVPLPDTRPSFDLTGSKREPKHPNPKRPDAKFAVHIPYMKIRGFRVELTNLGSDFKNGRIKWSCVLHQGSGKKALKCTSKECEINALANSIDGFDRFKKEVHSTFDGLKMAHSELQKSYVLNGKSRSLAPDGALETMRKLVDRHFPNEGQMVGNKGRKIAIDRDLVPVRIMAGLYACDYFTKRLR